MTTFRSSDPGNAWTAGQDITSLFPPIAAGLVSGDVFVFDEFFTTTSTNITIPNGVILAGGAAGAGVDILGSNGHELPFLILGTGCKLLDLTFTHSDTDVSLSESNNGASIVANGNNIEVRNSAFEGGPKEFIRASGNNHIYDSVTFNGAYYQHRWFGGCTGFTVNNCLYRDSTGDGIKTARSGGGVGTTNATVTNSVFLNNNRDGIDATAGFMGGRVSDCFFAGLFIGFDSKIISDVTETFTPGIEQTDIIFDRCEFTGDQKQGITTTLLNRDGSPAIIADAYAPNNITVQNSIFENTLLNAGDGQSWFIKNGFDLFSTNNQYLGKLVVRNDSGNPTALTKTGDTTGPARAKQPDSYYEALAGADFSVITYPSGGGPITPPPSGGSGMAARLAFGGVLTGDTLAFTVTQGASSDSATSPGWDVTPVVNPTYALGAFTAGSGGSPDSVAVNGDYTGGDTVDAYYATSNSATPPSAAQMEAGTGGTIVQSASVLGYTGAQADLSAFTNDTVTHLHAYFKERTNGGETSVSTTALTDIDFTAPTIGSWTTNAAGDTITGTISKSALIPDGQPATGDFTLAGVAAGSAIASVFVSGTSISLSIAANAAVDTDTITIAYAKGANTIQDARGNEVASFGATGVANIVPAPGAFAPSIVSTAGVVGVSNPTTLKLLTGVSVTSGNKYAAIMAGRTQTNSGAPATMSLGAASGTLRLSANDAGSIRDNHFGAVFEFVATATASVDLDILTSAGSGFQGVVVALIDMTGGQVKGTPTVTGGATVNTQSHDQNLDTGDEFFTCWATRGDDDTPSATGYTEAASFGTLLTTGRAGGVGSHSASATETPRTISTTASTGTPVAGMGVVNLVLESL